MNGAIPTSPGTTITIATPAIISLLPSMPSTPKRPMLGFQMLVVKKSM
jgi:hypothetical protein